MKVTKSRVRSDKLVVSAALRRIEITRREMLARKNMSPEQRRLAKRRRKKTKALAKPFIDGEAEETDDEGLDDNELYELLLREALRPVDSFGRPFLVPVNKKRKNPRFFRVVSDEYDKLLPVERRIVRRQVREYYNLLTSKY